MTEKEPFLKRTINRWKYIRQEGYWCKGYKEMIAIIGVIGVILITFSDYIFWSFGGKVANVTFAEKIQATTLFLTGVVIFWYTRETYDLKCIQNKQIEETRRQTELQQRPFLRLEWNTYPLSTEGYLTGKDISRRYTTYHHQLILVNTGFGVAVNVEINISLKNIKLVPKPFFKTVTAISSNGGKTQIFDAYDKEELREILDPTREGNSYEVTIHYKNLEKTSYKQVFKTSPNHNDAFEVTDW